MQLLWHRRFLQAFTKSVCYSNQWVTYFTPRPVISTFRQSGFKLVARDFRRCADTFKPPKFSFVPYFLYCRAIELGLKAIHLETERQQEVKEEYGHDLIRSYKALPQSDERSPRRIQTFSRKLAGSTNAKRLSMYNRATRPTATAIFPTLNSSLDWQPISRVNDT